MVLKVKVAQSCLTLCNPMYYTIHGILQARKLEWVAFPLTRGSFQPRDQTQVSHIIHLQCRRPQFESWFRKVPWRRDRLTTPIFLGFLCGSVGKESAMWETWIRSLGWEDPLEKGKVTLSSILAMGSQRVRHNWATFTHFMLLCPLSRLEYKAPESLRNLTKSYD